jgi:DNA recombination protein Rad52
MGFSDSQRRALTRKLAKRSVRTRTLSGTILNYVSGWHAISEANRIFGYDAWDRQTIEPRCIWSEQRFGRFACLYAAKVQITVRAGPTVITREGVGTGYCHDDRENTAHEIALKAAETDATKRALTTFGNPFGLALYDKTSPRKPPPEASAKAEIQLNSPGGTTQTFADPAAVIATIKQRIPELGTVRDVYAFWEANLETFVVLSRQASNDPVPELLELLKARGRELKAAETQDPQPETPVEAAEARQARPKERRARDKQHLRFVARHPCVICGRSPAQAHHVRFAQPRAMSMKVSDEYTVPLCNGHHDQLHQTGDERAWWARHAIDPIALAERLWQAEDKSEGADLDALIAARGRRRDAAHAAISLKTPSVKRLMSNGGVGKRTKKSNVKGGSA